METKRLAPAVQLGVAVFATGVLTACGGGGGGGGGNDDPPPVTQILPKTCVELANMTIPAEAISLPTRGAQVTSTEVVAASGSGNSAVGEYCKVLGEINPVDVTAPKIKFQLNLPTEWNKKALMFGGGGYNGTIPNPAANVSAGPDDAPTPQARGYATFASDSGHQAGPGGSRDGSFGLNDEALNNYASDALKKTHDAALHLLKARYAVDKPERTYFAGGSTGGREALAVAQKWPQDFDGAIVLYPAWNAAMLDLFLGRATRALAQPGAYPSREKRRVLYDAALEACDGLDGVNDGIVSNVNACNTTFDPATATVNGQPLRCPDGTDTGDTCLSDVQIAAIRTLNDPISFSYPLANGETQYPGFNVWGADLGMPGTSPLQPTVNLLALNETAPDSPSTLTMPYFAVFWDQWIRYFVTRDPNFDSLSFDPENPGQYQARVSELTALQDMTSTDLSAFEAKGGKILMAHGTHDVLVSSRSTAQYFERLQSTMGAEKTANFIRYYEIPAYGHAVSTTFNAAWDSLTTLENWVERGIAPPPQVVKDTVGVPGRTRPLCEYPTWPRYRGIGDVQAAASYTCVTE